MRRFQRLIGGVLLASAFACAAGKNYAQMKDPADGKKATIVQVKQGAGPSQPAPNAPGATGEAPSAEASAGAATPAAAPATPSAPSMTAPSAPSTSVQAPASGGTPSGTQLTSGNIAAAPAADLAGALTNNSANGVEIQRRNTVVADPRVRGYRTGQLVTIGDGGYFFPSRQDLDTAISKFDPGSIASLEVINGPYATRYGPGFAFLDIVTFNTPRCSDPDLGGLHGRTFLGYKTNGGQLNGLQSVSYGAEDWGFRASYNIMAGNDYRDGDGNKVPSSYNLQNFSVGLGVDLTPNSTLEFKAFHFQLRDVEFPGLYFDIKNLVTESYTLHYELKNQPWFDKFTADAWYNYTVVDGDTQQGAKQRFLSGDNSVPFVRDAADGNVRRIGFLAGPSGFGLNPLNGTPSVTGANAIADFSTSRIAETSAGYRLAGMWGKRDTFNVSVGTDFTYVAQALHEYIRLRDQSGINAIPPVFGNAAIGGITNDPRSNIRGQDTGIPNSFAYDPGVFIEANLPVGDRLTLHTGARGDLAKTTTSDRIITGNTDLFGATQAPGQNGLNRSTVDPLDFSLQPFDRSSDRTFGLWSAFLTGDYKFDDALTGLIGVGYAERAPTLTELYAAGPFVGILQPGLNRLIGDPHLAKERNLQFDVNLRADYGWFKGNIGGFYAWINDYITFDRNKSGDGITQVILTNTDRASLAGAEAYGQIEATSWMTPFASMSYVEGRDLTHRDNRRSGNLVSSRRDGDETEPLPSIPPLELRGGLRIHESVDYKSSPKWSVEGTCRSVFTQNLIATSLNEESTPGFTTVDIRAYWRASKWLTLTTGVENVGNRLYREHLDPRAGDQLYRQGTNYYFTTQFSY